MPIFNPAASQLPASTKQQVAGEPAWPGLDLGIHFLFPYSLESPGVPSLPPKLLLLLVVPLATSVFYTHFPWWGPQSGTASSPSPPPPPFHLPSQALAGLSSVQKGTLRQEQLQQATPTPHLLSLSLSPPNFVSLHTVTSPQQPASPSADILLLQCLTHLKELAPWGPQMSIGHCPRTWGSQLSAPGHTARSC